MDAYTRERLVFSCGNGGSASVANHMQCDHIKGVRNGTDLQSRVISLSSNVELLTAIANDVGYHDAFAYQLRAQSRPGDVLIVISSSGCSPNILHALQWACDNDIRTIALTGFEGGGARSTAEIAIHVDSSNYGIVEDLHQSIMHALAQYIRQHAYERGCHRIEHLLMASATPTPAPTGGLSLLPEPADENVRLRVAINLLTEDPRNPSGAHWFWTRIVPEMADRLQPGEELHLILSPTARREHPDYGGAVRYITFPWSNEHRVLRTASEHLLSPFRLPLNHIDVLNTSVAPLVNPSWDLVIHIKTMHAFTTPGALGMAARTYRRLNYQRSVRLAEAVIINSHSLRNEIDQYLEVDPEKIRLIPEAVDHDVFKIGDREAARAHVAAYGAVRPFVLFVSSIWRYKNCDGLIKAWKVARPELAGRQLVIVGAERDQQYAAELHALVDELGMADDVVFVGGVPLEETARFYQAADLLVYPSLNETFGLPILEAMACACPVVTSNVERDARDRRRGGPARRPARPGGSRSRHRERHRFWSGQTADRGGPPGPAVHLGRHRRGDA